MLVVGSMIGSGIFIVSAESARLVGTPGRLLAVWVVAGALTLLAALACAELATMFPLAGGPYVFFREAYGPLAGFLYGWTMALVVQTGTIAAVAVAFSKFLGVLVPSVSGGATKVVAGVGRSRPDRDERARPQGGNARPERPDGREGRGAPRPDGGGTPPRAAPARTAAAHAEAPFSGALVVAFALALVGPAFSQSAWTNVTFPGAEVKDPGRTFPRALLVGCALVTGLYVLANVGYLKVLGLPGIAHAPQDRVGTRRGRGSLPGRRRADGGRDSRLDVRVRERPRPLRGARRLGARGGRPSSRGAARAERGRACPGVALALQAAWALVLVALGDVLRSPALRRLGGVRRPHPPRPRGAGPAAEAARRASGRTGRGAIPRRRALFALPAGAVVVLLAIASPKTTWPGFGLVLLGVPVFFVRRRATA